MNKIIEFIPLEFIGSGESKGNKYKQILKNEVAYIYSVNDDEYFEVIKRKITPKLINFEKRLYSDSEFKEIYPKAKYFGINGWTFNSLKVAKTKFNELTSHLNIKN